MENLPRNSDLDAYAPWAMPSFRSLERAVFAPGVLSTREKRLIAVAVALTTPCPGCVEPYRKAAVEAGADEAELAEAAMVIAVLRARAAVTLAMRRGGAGRCDERAHGLAQVGAFMLSRKESHMSDPDSRRQRAAFETTIRMPS
jgi:AhpD family alkylhydroperoxidase